MPKPRPLSIPRTAILMLAAASLLGACTPATPTEASLDDPLGVDGTTVTLDGFIFTSTLSLGPAAIEGAFETPAEIIHSVADTTVELPEGFAPTELRTSIGLAPTFVVEHDSASAAEMPDEITLTRASVTGMWIADCETCTHIGVGGASTADANVLVLARESCDAGSPVSCTYTATESDLEAFVAEYRITGTTFESVWSVLSSGGADNFVGWKYTCHYEGELPAGDARLTVTFTSRESALVM